MKATKKPYIILTDTNICRLNILKSVTLSFMTGCGKLNPTFHGSKLLMRILIKF